MLDQFIYSELSHCRLDAKNSSAHTHTRIGCRKENLYGGSFDFSNSKDYHKFIEMYKKHVFVEKKLAYYTEKQLDTGGPVLVDFDLKYEPKKERQYTCGNLFRIARLYIEMLNTIYDITDTTIMIYMFEKKNVVHKENMTKDGIHMLIGIGVDRVVQVHLRELVLAKIKDTVHIPNLINEWEMIIDESVTSGKSNWQLFGSRKPKCKPYKLSMILRCHISGEGEINIQEDMNKFDIIKSFDLLSARYTGNPTYPVRTECHIKTKQYKIDKPINIPKIISPPSVMGEKYITCEAELDAILEELFMTYEVQSLSVTMQKKKTTRENVDVRELYKYVMSLPSKFYEEGSYDRWMRVCWALKNTSDDLFPIWVKMSSQKESFSYYEDVPKMRQWWDRSKMPHNSTPLTYKSIRYWSQHYSPELYQEITDDSTERLIQKMLTRQINETDIAGILHRMFKDRFVCCDIQHNIWYEFNGNRWRKMDAGTGLRNTISTILHDKFWKFVMSNQQIMNSLPSDTDMTALEEQTKKMSEICNHILRTHNKKSIMYEAQHNFKDDQFLRMMDTNPYLMCFNNGVYDFHTNEFRQGRPDDYISMCTNISYRPINYSDPEELEIISEINDFFEQLMPNDEFREYMWNYLSSCLIGINKQQAINIWIGKGCNGKTKLVELMQSVLGDYYGTMPVALITQSRVQLGGTCSEIAQLRGVRLAVMQEPSQGDKINDGVLKQYTGGDQINARELYQQAMTYTPQFKISMCTNTLPQIRSTDDGIWRRIRTIYFESKFTEKPYEDERFPREQYPYQFPIDRDIEHKFNRWSGIFMAMLIERVMKNNGNVIESELVMKYSMAYRDDQDVFADFFRSCIRRDTNSKIMKTEVSEHFRQWYTQHYGRDIPKGKDLYDYLNTHCGKHHHGGWHHHSIIYE